MNRRRLVQATTGAALVSQVTSVLAPLTEEMVRHGYSDEQIRGILGENFLRVFAEAWR